MKRILTTLLFILLLSSPAQAVVDHYWASTVSGGTSGAMDAIDGSILSDGDKCLIQSTTGISFYTLDADSGVTESIPTVIAPDDNPGNKRWLLVKVVTGNEFYVDPAVTNIGAITTEGNRSLKDIVDTIGTSEKATIVFSHYGQSNTTVYTISTSETVPSNFTLVVESGALITDDASNASLTINGPIKAGAYQVFNWGNGSGTLTGVDPIINPVWFGAVEDGATNDRDAIQQAIDFGPTSGTLVKFTPGLFYDIGSSLTLKSNLTLDMYAATLIWEVDDQLFTATGTEGSSTNLTANGTIGSNTVAVTSASGFSADGYIFITSTSDPTGNGEIGEVHRIKSIAGNTITLVGQLWDTYNTADTASASPWTPITNVKLLGGTISGNTADTGTAIAIEWYRVSNFLIKDMTFSKIAETAIGLYHCTEGRIEGNYIYGSAKTGLGYGVLTSGACSNIDIGHNHFAYVRHATTGGSSAGARGEGAPHGINIHHNLFEDTSAAACDVHETTGSDFQYNHNIFYRTNGTFNVGVKRWSASNNMIIGSQYGFIDRGNQVEEITLINNIYDGGNYASGNDEYGILFDSTSLTKVVIDGLDLKNIGERAVYIDASNSTAAIEVSRVSFTDGSSTYAVDMHIQSAAASRVAVNHCILAGGQGNGIRIDNAGNATLIGNDVKNYDQAGYNNENGAGIYLNTCGDVMLVGNNTYDDQGTATQPHGIYCDSCTSVLTEGNKFSGNNVKYFGGITNGVLYLQGQATWNPASIADGDEEATDVTVTGARLGDFVLVSFSLDVLDLVLDAQVTSANTVTCVLSNNTGGAVDLGSGTVYVKLIRNPLEI